MISRAVSMVVVMMRRRRRGSCSEPTASTNDTLLGKRRRSTPKHHRGSLHSNIPTPLSTEAQSERCPLRCVQELSSDQIIGVRAKQIMIDRVTCGESGEHKVTYISCNTLCGGVSLACVGFTLHWRAEHASWGNSYATFIYQLKAELKYLRQTRE